jgi:phosphoenolpyruvate-protein phosphotransferase
MIQSGRQTSEKPRQNTRCRGVSVCPGLAAGRAFLYADIFEQDHTVDAHEPVDSTTELERLQRAAEQVREDLNHATELLEGESVGDVGEIFLAHEMILSSPGLRKELEARLAEGGVRAEFAIQEIFRKREQRFLEMTNPRFRQRAEDLADIARRLLRKLAGIERHSLETFPDGRILVARKLYASEIVFLGRGQAKAIVTESGSPGSHVAVLAQAMGIPAVTRVQGVTSVTEDGDLLLVDGLRGTVVLHPDEETLAAFSREQERFGLRIATAVKRRKEPACTADGCEIPVMANVTLQDDAVQAVRNGADGIGLYRMEGFYFERGSLPSEEELVTEIGANLAVIEGLPACLRLLDIGGDKQLPYLSLPTEANPFLGRRGIRLLFDQPQMLQAQLRACLRLSCEHDVSILVPMITRSEEMKRVRDMAEREAADLGIGRLPMIGAMIETPAAALSVGEIVRYADFLSIGTNDLTQYVMAADRDSPLVASYFQDDHPAIFRLIRMIVADAAGKPVAVCGRLAGREEAVPQLLAAGVSQLSVAAPLIPIIKEAARSIRAE